MPDPTHQIGLLERAGKLLFRLRSFTPLPVILAGLLLSWRAQVHAGLGGPEVDSALNVLGVVLCALGSTIRFLTVGFTPRSNSQTRIVSTGQLLIEGPYALVRHPLYLGNACITLGLLAIVDQLAAWLVVSCFFLVSYALIIHAEEAHLREKFGPGWERWARRVPSLWPRLNAREALRGLPFDWKTAVRREITPFVSWAAGAQLLLGWEWWARGELTTPLAHRLWAGLAALLVLLLGNKLSKPKKGAIHDLRP